MPLKTLLIDNYDSFTYNLYQMLAHLGGQAPLVIKNDQLTWQEITALEVDNIVLSPGPGRPQHVVDFGVCRDVIEFSALPILGVCLGHQGIAHVFGGDVVPAPEVMHGRLSDIYHDASDIFRGIPSPFAAVRYHSWIVGKPLPTALDVLATTKDGLVMALKHRRRPIWAVQFHPESICSEYGLELLANFYKLSREHLGNRSQPAGHPTRKSRAPRGGGSHPTTKLSLQYHRMAMTVSSISVFEAFYRSARVAFWLDSALTSSGRFSFMGDISGPNAAWLAYHQTEKTVVWHRHQGCETLQVDSLFQYLKRQLSEYAIQDQGLPFDFQGGLVGYFGYEMQVECGFVGQEKHEPRRKSEQPDACFVVADRFIAFDHWEQKLYLVALSQAQQQPQASKWIADTAERLAELAHRPAVPQRTEQQRKRVASKVSKRITDGDYLQKIATIQEKIALGETYEACLTNMLALPFEGDVLQLYSDIRQANPAPYACYFRFPEFTILSASPEKFLHIDQRGRVETKPIKGTRPRGRTPQHDFAIKSALASSEKDRAENLMIVDLLRNDLSKVSSIGSVVVSKLFAIESYASVHQLVSTIESQLDPSATAVDCVVACFPGGSMTGAPKQRTLEILQELEAGPRGIYSGSIGYFSFNGAAQFNIVIRSLVLAGGHAKIGVGGAIVALSKPEEELQETELKAKGLLAVLNAFSH